ncbi:MAG: hypothetical protein OXG23_10335 [Chloroflexi bacterium]|nr:hypothetical protein [Chloroflexota bacterium]MDE2638433.1 hypothetical protein [Chloroflexota bacterium]
MENLSIIAPSLHKQRMHELMEEAKIERFLNDKKNRKASDWLQRRLHRNRKAY